MSAGALLLFLIWKKLDDQDDVMMAQRQPKKLILGAYKCCIGCLCLYFGFFHFGL